MKKRRSIVPLVVVVVLAALANPVRAAIEDFSVDYGSPASPLAVDSSVNLSLSQFNNSLGTLTGVTIELFSYDTISSVIYNANSELANYTGATATMPVTVTALGGVTTSATGTAGPFAGSLTTLGLSVAGSTLLPLQTASINPGGFLPYEGAGDIPFSVAVADSVGTYSGSGPSSLFFGGSGSSYGTVEIDYSYTPIPEPATLCMGLAMMGVCGIELARRRRRFPVRS